MFIFSLINFLGTWIAQKPGKTKFSIFFDGNLVRENQIVIHRGHDASKCRIYGDGLERAFVHETAEFYIDTQVIFFLEFKHFSYFKSERKR